ncbi:hypothetical protein XENTR_v10022533 [Xenopus tropicalis]|nr:hypothetical protein XENTR_v10022533 [Xenopus tropicalis]
MEYVLQGTSLLALPHLIMELKGKNLQITHKVLYRYKGKTNGSCYMGNASVLLYKSLNFSPLHPPKIKGICVLEVAQYHIPPIFNFFLNKIWTSFGWGWGAQPMHTEPEGLIRPHHCSYFLLFSVKGNYQLPPGVPRDPTGCSGPLPE